MTEVDGSRPSVAGLHEPRHRRLSPLRTFTCVIAFAGLTLSFTAPITAVFAVQLGSSAFAAGLCVSSLTMVVLVLDLFGMKALPFLEPRRSIVIGMVIWALGSFASAVAPTFAIMEASRLFQGLGLAVFSAAGPQLAVRLAGGANVGAALGGVQAAQTLGSTLAPLAGGAILALSPGISGSRIAFAVCGALALAVAIAARLMLPRFPSATAPRVSLPRISGLGSRRMLAAFFSAAGGQGVRAALVLTIVPLVATEGVGITTAAVGVLITADYCVEVLAARVAGPYSDRRGRRPAIIVGSLAGLIAVCALLGAALLSNLFILLTAIPALGVAGGSLLSVLPASIVDLSPRPENGIATMRLSRDFGFAACPVAAGALISFSGSTAALTTCALVYIGVLLLTAVVGETRRR